MVILLHPGDFVKEILSHLTYFFCVKRASLLCYRNQNLRGEYKESLFVDGSQELPTYCL